MVEEFKLPRSIPVFAQTYLVRLVRNLKSEDDVKLLGEAHTIDQCIRLERGLSQDKRKEIFWHEVVEALRIVLFIKLKHSEVAALAHGLELVADKVIQAQKK